MHRPPSALPSAPSRGTLPRVAMSRKRLQSLGLALTLALGSAAAGCRDLSYAAGDPKELHVGIVFDSGGKDDRSFNAAAYRGVEPAAKDFPIVHFAIVDGVSDLPNVASLIFKEHEGSYLVGMIAARTTKTGTLGFVGGMDVPLIHKFEVGYEEGARAANPKIRVIQNYVGVTETAWNNPGKGKELAVAQIGKGADVIFAAAGNSGLGVFDAAEQYDKYVIGVDSNQNWVKPGHVLTSMVKRVDNAVYQIINDLVHHRFHGGIHVYGLQDGGIGYAMDQYNAKLISPDVLREVEAAKAKIIAGQIKVTDAMAQ